MSFSIIAIFLSVLVTLLSSVDSFAPALSVVSTSTSALAATPFLQAATTLPIAAVTLDPTTLLSDAFAGLIGTPAILAVPIVLALGVASTIAWLIVAYASPAESED